MKENNFNFLRFYFAFIVVIGHLIEISDVNEFIKLAPYFSTYISVTAFFCISGFLITRSYLHSHDQKDYFKKRAARLLPAYIFVIFASAILLSILSDYRLAEYFTHPQLFKYLAANLSFLNFLQPSLPGVFEGGGSGVVNGALWTLKIEVSFYLVLPLLLYYAKKINRKYILFLSIYILSVIYRNNFEHIAMTSGNGFYTILARQLPGFFSYFVCGMSLYYYFELFTKFKKHLFLIGVLIIAIERLLNWEILTPFALSIIVFSFAFSVKWLNSFAKHGDISYGIYIFHYPIMKLASYYGFFKLYNPILVAFSIITIVIFVGFASWHFIEKPFLKKTHSSRL